MVLCVFAGSSGWAQQFGPTNIIPIAKVRVPYLNIREDGSGKSCGVRLFGDFPVFKRYTNHNSYTLFTPGLQSNPHLNFSSTPPEPGGTLRFYCYFNGIDTGNTAAECPSQIGEQHPDWFAYIRPRGPVAAMSAEASPNQPGLWSFRSRSGELDPEGDQVTERWEFGDGDTSTAISVNHQYRVPGNFTAALVVTDSDGLTNRASRVVTIPAPKLETTLRMPENPPGDTRVTLGKDFKVRLTVKATDDGIGALSQVRFFTNAILNLPSWIVVREQPSSFEIGTLQPGEFRSFDFTLQATNVGRFSMFSTYPVAVDAAGRALNGRVATLNGSVPGLRVEVVFPPETVRLKRKEQGEGNVLSEVPGYESQAFPVIFRVSVPTNGPPVRNVRFNNADANDGGVDIDRVKRTTNPDVPWVQAVPQPVPFPLSITNKASPAMFPGLMTEKSPPVEFKVMVQTDTPGDFSFTGIFSALREDGTGEVTEVGTDVMTVGGDVLLAVQVEMVHPLVNPRIDEGDAVEVWGLVKNMTWDDTIELYPVQVVSQGQGFVLGPVASDREVPPVGVPGIFNPKLGPRESRTFRARVKTEVIPGLDLRLLGRTSVLVDFAVGGELVKESGEKVELKPEDILVEWGKGKHRPGNNVTLLRAQVDPKPQDTRLLSPEDFFLIAAGSAMENAALGGRDFFLVSIPQTLTSIIPGMWALMDTAGALSVEQAILMRNSGRYLWAWLDWQTDVYLGLESETRRQQYQLIADELYFYYSDKFESVEEVSAMVNKGIEGYFAKVLDYKDRAYEASSFGFNEELAGIVGEPFRAGTRLALEEIVGAAAVQGFVAGVSRSRAIIDEAAAAKAASARRAEEEVAKATAEVARRGERGNPRVVEATPGMKALPPKSLVAPHQTSDGWAVDKVSDANLRRMTDVKNGGMSIIVAVRSRADETIEWMKTSLGIVPKPVSFKPKNVDVDDVEFLGYRDGVGYGDANGVGAGDRGATALAEPFSREEVLVRLELRGADEAKRASVLERHNQRWEEWYGAPWPDKNPSKSAVEKLKSLTDTVEVVDGRVIRKGRLEVPRRGTTPDSSINRDTSGLVVMDQRRFEMRQVKNPPGNSEFPDGREYYECWLEDDQGIMRRIAGDIDIVAVTDASGHVLPAASQFTEAVARNLQHGVQAQHPWSSSLRNPAMREKFLKAHRWHRDPAKRGEPLLVYVNGEARVGWFHPTRTISDKDPLAGFMWLDGGTGDVDDVVQFQRDMRGTVSNPADVNLPSHKPMQANVRAAMIDSDNKKGTTLLGRCAIRTARTGGAVYRMGQAESLEERQADGSWVPADPAAACDGGELVIVPETALTDGVVSGTLRLPIIEDLLGFDWRDMFRVGDEIMIAPGTPTEEVRTVVDRGSLILDRPLDYSHPMGTTIILHRAREVTGMVPPVPPPRGGPLVWLRADAGVERDGTNVVSWTDQSGHGFVFRADVATRRPNYATNVVNGLPTVQFTGATRDRMVGNLGLTLSNATIFSVCRFVGNASAAYVYSFGTRNFSGLMMTLARRSGDGAYHYDGAAQRIADNAIGGTQFRIFSQVYGGKGGDSHVLTEGTRTLLDTRTTVGRDYSAVATNVVLGDYVTGSGSFTGDLVEWIVYDRALSVTERLEVEEYLRRRLGLPSFFAPGSLSLRDWQPEHFDVSPAPAAVWNLNRAERAVGVSQVADPSVLLSPYALPGQTLRARFSAGTSPGFVGFVFGWQNPGEFYLLDWQRTASTNAQFGIAPRGLRLRAFHLPAGNAPTGTDLWSSPDPSRVTLLQAQDLPWVPGREYELQLTHEFGRIELAIVDGATNVVSWTVEDSRHPPRLFGFYLNGPTDAELGQVTMPGTNPIITRIDGDESGNVRLEWLGGVGPYLIETTTGLGASPWVESGPSTPAQSQTVEPVAAQGFYRIRAQGVPP